MNQELLFILSFIYLSIPQMLTERNCLSGIVVGTREQD